MTHEMIEQQLWVPPVAAWHMQAVYILREGWQLTSTHRRDGTEWAVSPPPDWYSHLNSDELIGVVDAHLEALLLSGYGPRTA